jgi:hypothetical protein
MATDPHFTNKEPVMARDPEFRDADVRRRVRHLIEQGRLPLAPPTQRMTAGYGTGHTCAACDQQITSSQMEYAVEGTGTPLWFHLGCRLIWQLECAQQPTS